MNLEIIHTAPAMLATSERLLLYALIYGLRPQRCLEIGTARGGSALIICAALDQLGSGHLVIVDPSPQIAPEDWARMAHRAILIAQPSPEALLQAFNLTKSPFDFVFIDGNHGFEYVLKDIEGVLPFLQEGGYILLHDAHYFEVAEAIEVALQRHPELIDCGMIAREANVTENFYKGQRVVWAGFRLLRFCPKPAKRLRESLRARLAQWFPCGEKRR
ncbi:MAG: class I SAM-dependent methyltransferase [Candidatus Bipolaricaulota bacterium]|nr:class I SAM-dependent methyltransferase [Candidatus Bipolaricaulota bacterium]MDW8030974.1 class I SAM-dependent methyltransferase [Candidatus Bipolaricaulota bacterium]